MLPPAAPAGKSPPAGSGQPASTRWCASTLSFLAGYVDTAGFIALFGLFTAHVTGNFVLLGRALVEPHHDVQLKLLAFPAFIAAVALCHLLVLRWQRHSGNALRRALLLQLGLLLAAAICGWLAAPIRSSDAPLVMLSGLLCTAAMGVQNAYGKLLLPQLAATTVMTGNVTQLVIDAIDAARGPGAARPADKMKLLWPVLSFAAGAFGGALAVSRYGMAALLLPCFLLAVLAATARRGN